jgi:hypothetical protein
VRGLMRAGCGSRSSSARSPCCSHSRGGSAAARTAARSRRGARLRASGRRSGSPLSSCSSFGVIVLAAAGGSRCAQAFRVPWICPPRSPRA